MAGVGEQGGGIAEHAIDDFGDDEGEIEGDADGEGAAETGGRVNMAGVIVVIMSVMVVAVLAAHGSRLLSPQTGCSRFAHGLPKSATADFGVENFPGEAV